jgi:hypothetical protein
MSERPDLFLNKKSSLAEIIEVRIDATRHDATVIPKVRNPA